ncbi:hypothetical protein ACFQ0K_02825 [Nocardioides caeni]|uniref:Zinc-finger domain-containing protein n=1 Tax=Nocardioides caeni TaxID=574700 RepID=A0A4S8NNU3_9ACTN|nr:hypothetical protein [Nocardioides caeni]THV18245.1 hypothetical protein E9934_00970 [Nocardioides caeni]
MIGHLGNRVSALLDGQLAAREAEEAWAHVYACHPCRDLVEREGWVKTRLAGLAGPDNTACGGAPSGLKGSLLSMPPGDGLAVSSECGHHGRRHTGVVLIGGGAVGAAMLGVLALGLAPGSAPAERRPPATQVNTSVPSPSRTSVAGTLATNVVGQSSVVRTPLRRMLP